MRLESCKEPCNVVIKYVSDSTGVEQEKHWRVCESERNRKNKALGPYIFKRDYTLTTRFAMHTQRPLKHSPWYPTHAASLHPRHY